MTPHPPSRGELLAGAAMPPARELLAEGRALAARHGVGRCAFLDAHRVASELHYKIDAIEHRRVMRHAQIGWRDPGLTVDAAGRIFERLERDGAAPDRYGICLDWSMGYRAAERAGRPRGTGLIVDDPATLERLTAAAPAAPHFGDFVLGFPAATENTIAALAAGATSIGNLGQYFTFRLPGVDDDVERTLETVKALGLIAAQPVPVLVHSNLDDGFAAVFADLACALGAVLVERHVVDRLCGARVSHCYGHHFSDPLARAAFQRALAMLVETPGTMIYGNTTSYRGGHAANFASLASYLLVDVLGQRRHPTGHAVNPVPVTENERIPDVDEIVDAQRFAARLAEHAAGHAPLVDERAADALAARLADGARRFHAGVLAGLAEAGIDIGDAAEVLLAIRRVGGRRLEALYGPGRADAGAPRGRRAVHLADPVREIETQARAIVDGLAPQVRAGLAGRALTACVATSDVHEHGKLLLEAVLDALGIAHVDGGVSTDPQALARTAHAHRADLVALSTYNGIALDFARELHTALAAGGAAPALFVGGRLNQVPEDSNSALPVDVSRELAALGAVPCARVEDMLEALAAGSGPRAPWPVR